MNQYEITIALMLAAQLITVFLLRKAVEDAEAWRKAWLRESRELLKLKKEQN
jgi:hypothetical protein